jgi:hypothetical protein
MVQPSSGSWMILVPSALAVRHVASVAVDGVVAVMAVAVEVEHPVTSQPARRGPTG